MIKTGELIATRVVSDQDCVAELHGAVLVARRDEPVSSEASDLSNVVPFARPRRQGAAPDVPLPSVAAVDRLAPGAVKFELSRGAAFIVASLALHGMLLAIFWRDPIPLASIGVEAITSEITLGATTAAGLAQQPGEQEVQLVKPSEQVADADEPVAQQSQQATLQSQDVPVAAQEMAPEAKPQEAPQVETAQPAQQPPQPEPQTTISEVPAEVQPTEKPPEQVAQAQTNIPNAKQAPERKRVAAPTKKKVEQKKKAVASATPTDAASGVGRGRSDRSANYNGMVAAHLARYKQYPAAARSAGTQGTAAVSFSIDGGGRVTSARLARSSGNSALDQEVVAMARRASPFPAPPDGRGRNFTVPVRFNLR